MVETATLAAAAEAQRVALLGDSATAHPRPVLPALQGSKVPRAVSEIPRAAMAERVPRLVEAVAVGLASEVEAAVTATTVAVAPGMEVAAADTAVDLGPRPAAVARRM